LITPKFSFETISPDNLVSQEECLPLRYELTFLQASLPTYPSPHSADVPFSSEEKLALSSWDKLVIGVKKFFRIGKMTQLVESDA
jgi:hypothetical protein